MKITKYVFAMNLCFQICCCP